MSTPLTATAVVVVGIVIGGAARWGIHSRALRQARAQARAVGSAVWQKVADVLNDTVGGRYLVGSAEAAGLVAAAHRLLDRDGSADVARLFEGGAGDCLPTASRAVRIYGPIGSGKTVCARRLVVQEIGAGRHVTVIRSGTSIFGKAQYAFSDGHPGVGQFDTIDAEDLETAGARRALTASLDRRDDRKNGVSRPDETVLVDTEGSLPAKALRDLIVGLVDVVANPGNRTRLVVLVDGPEDLCDPAGLFDTEIILPGRPPVLSSAGVPIHQVDPGVLRAALRRFSREELTLLRLEARVSVGGVVTSRHERQILAGLCESDREYLASRTTEIIEPPMAATAGLQHGILKAPNGTLMEFSLPLLAGHADSPPVPYWALHNEELEA